MNAIQRFITASFDLVLQPLEHLGMELALIVVSGVFGVLALLVFKYISPQASIRRAKDLIKGHMIEIRLYQDDLRLVTKAIGKVLWHNLRYVCLNFGPFIPLAVPFALVAGQLVARYAFEPMPVTEAVQSPLAGDGHTLSLNWEGGDPVTVRFPEGLVPVSPLIQVSEQGRGFQEFVVRSAGHFEIEIERGGESTIKRLWAGERDSTGHRYPAVQPLRTSNWEQILWPAEASLSHWERVEFRYPESSLGWLPGQGPGGVLLNMILFSMLFGFAALKPLGVEI
ncbi:MAG: hypothetical protein P1V35_08620 [Planctomycetota bacterium]|nr:hypothetical protein [Planctomycetota bacterium]